MDFNKTVNTDLFPLSANYKHDKQFVFDNNYFQTDIGYNFITNKFLTNCRDQKINNYSNYYLTDKLSFTDVGDIVSINNPKSNIVTYLQINNLYICSDNNALYLNNIPVNKFEIVFIQSDPINLSSLPQTANDINMEVSTFAAKNNIHYEYCYLKTYSEYLNQNLYVTKDLTLSSDIDDAAKFCYILNNLQLVLYLTSNKPTESGSKFLTIVDNNLQFSEITSLSSNNIIDIDQNILNNVNYNTSWGVYSDNGVHLNKDKSYYNLTNNLLVNSIYTYSDGNSVDVDLLTLKNQITTKNYVDNGDSFRDVNFREYTKLFTGTNQEGGNNSISINYNYLTTDIKIVPGRNVFTTPESIYPFKQLDINDSSFAINGAFGGKQPSLADRIYKVNNNDLLQSYSWLSCNDMDDKGIWLTRYYNPMLFNYQKVSTEPANILANDTEFDKILYNNPELINVGYFDVKSGLILEPNTQYVYDRITHDDLVTFTSNNPYNVIDSLKVYNSNNTLVYDDNINNQVYKFNGDRYARVDIKTVAPYNQFCISFYINGDNWDNIVADQIMGNYNCDGFAFKKNTIITPTPMITFSRGSFFNVDDVWNNINETLLGETSKWSKFDVVWNSNTSVTSQNARGQYLFNTAFSAVDILPYTDALVRTVRIEHIDYYYNVYQTQLVKTTPTGVEIASISLGLQEDEIITAVSYDENNIYCISNKNMLYEYSMLSSAIITSFDFSESLSTIGTQISSINAVVKIGDSYYFTSTKNGILEYNKELGIFYCNYAYNNFNEIEDICILRANPDDFYDKINYIYNQQDGELKYTKFFSIPISAESDSIFNDIQDFKIINDTICVLYKGTKLAVYDFNRTLRYSYDFASINQNVKYIDYVSEITPAGYDSYYIILTYDKVFDAYTGKEIFYSDSAETVWTGTDYLSLYKLVDKTLSLINKTSYSQTLMGDYDDNHLTNYSLIAKRHADRNNFYIQYKLLNKYNDSYEVRIINLPDFAPGSNHIAINFNGIEGNLQVYINGKLMITDVFDAGKYVYENIFNDIFLVGNISYFSEPLFKFLKQNNYFCNHFSIEQFKLYNNVLDGTIIKALSLYNTRINDLILNIPCDSRNKIERFERMFKESVPGMVTNKINLNIKNMTINEKDQHKLSNAIKLILKNKLMLNVDVNDINYKFTI